MSQAPSVAVRSSTPGLAPAGIWDVDPSHSNVEFVVRHMFTKMRGRFSEFTGTIELGENLEDSKAEGTIAVAGIDTGNPDRDAHLRSPDFFDIEAFPSLSFRSTGVRPGAGGDLVLDGELTIKGVSRPVVLDVEFTGSAADPFGGERAGFSARTEIDREDFGLSWNVALETGGVLVGRKIRIELEIEAVRRQDSN
ncbi:MAG: YceI family protein [Acidimicrobiia bacterium]